MEQKFIITAPFEITPPQKAAAQKLADGLTVGNSGATLLGVTGCGKTFVIANLIQKIQRPTLLIAPNKTLAAQLYAEMKTFFPHNAVEYFISYYDFYQPEAYLPGSDTYIEKDASINNQIEQMRLSATKAILEREDVIIVASVSAIYGLGDPDTYAGMVLIVKIGTKIAQHTIAERLAELQYSRNDFSSGRGTYRIRGDVVDIFLAEANDFGLRLEWLDDELTDIYSFDITSGKRLESFSTFRIFPKNHYVVSRELVLKAINEIKHDLTLRLQELYQANKLVEAQRLEQRTLYDIEMLLEVGYCNGIENYSRYFSERNAGEPPPTLIDYFPERKLIVLDESHVTLPQLHSMYHGDRSRKLNLVEYGFRLPSALDNRPLNFSEFEKIAHPVVYVSATPGSYELEHSAEIVELLIRPTGLIDPKVSVRPVANQVDDLVREISKRVTRRERVLALTLTKKMAEHLSEYVIDLGIKAKYLHSEINTLERVEILRDFRLGKFDLLIGINLLREGLDLPEIALVAILDADKEGFLRSTSALIQISGRAARNVNGEVIMYADKITPAMQIALDEMRRRREQQIQYNSEHRIIPRSVKKQVIETLATDEKNLENSPKQIKQCTASQLRALEAEMHRLAANLEFEKAAKIRDELRIVRSKIN